jgi:hypothetical protein
MVTHSLLWFSPPVSVKTDRTGVTHHVNNVQGAAQELLKWKLKGPLWNRAVRVCIAAIAGEVPPEEARDAFRAAAVEEGVLRQKLDGPLGEPLTNPFGDSLTNSRKPTGG